MCTKTTKFDIVKLYAIFDLILTIATIVIAVYAHVENTEIIDAEKLKHNAIILHPQMGPGFTRNAAASHMGMVLVFFLIVAPTGIFLSIGTVLFAVRF